MTDASGETVDGVIGSRRSYLGVVPIKFISGTMSYKLDLVGDVPIIPLGRNRRRRRGKEWVSVQRLLELNGSL